ncbi:hypothetical protein U1Q18_020964 [Sarracenia purpurea var. burkii]
MKPTKSGEKGGFDEGEGGARIRGTTPASLSTSVTIGVEEDFRTGFPPLSMRSVRGLHLWRNRGGIRKLGNSVGKEGFFGEAMFGDFSGGDLEFLDRRRTEIIFRRISSVVTEIAMELRRKSKSAQNQSSSS